MSLVAHGTAATVWRPRPGSPAEAPGLTQSLTIRLAHPVDAGGTGRKVGQKVREPRAEDIEPDPGERYRMEVNPPVDEFAVQKPAPAADLAAFETGRSPNLALGAPDRRVAHTVVDVPVAPSVQKPRFKRQPSPPRYPDRARRLHQEGVVVLDGLVGVHGKAREILVWSSSGFPLLDEAAREVMEQWAFEPAWSDGVSLESWVRVPVHFALR